ncbi:lectin like domain-containing protein [Cloacibacillus sp.]|uniref:lectin like domain-containing protein n=1 Tax=Cloacibacillus sp. TaxID=2049023 RepID=UPI0025BBF19A|nr:lectin like domain-containing protein [Cloacibacillus sp.]MCC8056617.1 lectin like domain-containing protein [Cloacibacillus sp.]
MSKLFQRKSVVFVIMILVTALIYVVPAAAALKAAPLNPDFVKWRDARETAANAKALSATQKSNYGYAPSPVNWSHLNGVVYSVAPDSMAIKSALATLPASYDLRTSMPPVRNQYPFGNCWTYAAMAATEFNLIGKRLASSSDIDLSEWYLTYFAYNDESSLKPGFTNSSDEAYYDAGGSPWLAVALLSRGTGSVSGLKVATPVGSNDVYVPNVMEREWKLKNALYLNIDVQKAAERRQLVKETIMAYGVVLARFYWDDDAFNKDNFAYYLRSDYSTVNHDITIVGWDDDYPKENFNDGNRPRENGAWLVRNSWGAGWGDKGYFHVSYEEGTLCNVVVFDTVSAPVDEKIYQYDPLGLVGFLGERGKNEVYFANIFTAGAYESVNSVAFYTTAPDQPCEIKIYTGCDGSPVSGKLARTASVTVKAPGYNTVELDAPVKVVKGEKFSVVVKTSSDLTDFLVPGEYALSKYSEKASSERGQSWVSIDGGVTFEDVSDPNTDAMNVCLKAFATPESAHSSGGCSAGFAALALLVLVPIILKKRS